MAAKISPASDNAGSEAKNEGATEIEEPEDESIDESSHLGV